MNATPENFKPGERWLMAGSPFAIEVVCVEWSPSSEWVKMLIVSSDKAGWFRATELIEQSNTLTGGRNLYQTPTIKLLERLPDVESGNYKTESESRLEAAGREWPCTCDHCAKIKAWVTGEGAHLDRIIEKHKGKIEPGRTFSVVPPEDAETKA